MPGTYTFKPIEANITKNITLSSPFCTFLVGDNKVQTKVCTEGGKHPHWKDVITLPISDGVSTKVQVSLKDQDETSEKGLGSFTLDLKDVQKTGQMSQWYLLYNKKKCVGEILMETSFQPEPLSVYSTTVVKGESVPRLEETLPLEHQTTVLHQQPAAVIMEQKQIVEPHTFLKQIEAVETRTQTKEIEVMEPVKVIKEVPETETVHVKRLVEVTKPFVVTKEVEVMEPRLVTKTIQVIEDVPVKRRVEVIEYKTELEEIDTIEPRTVMKPIEVTEYVPVKKEVEVIEPVTVKKEVEYIEPLITTKTVIKEIPQAVVVGEEVTRTVGPATILETKQGNVMETKLMKEEIRQEKALRKEGVIKEKIVTEKVVEKPVAIEKKSLTRIEQSTTLKVEQPIGKVEPVKAGKTEPVFSEHYFCVKSLRG